MNRIQQHVIALAVAAAGLPACTVPSLLGKDDASGGGSGGAGGSEAPGPGSDPSGTESEGTDPGAATEGSGDPIESETGGAAGPVFAERCPEIAMESAQCIVTTAGEILGLGMDSGDVCVINDTNRWGPHLPIPFLPAYGGLAWEGEQLYGCHAQDEDLHLHRYDLATGAIETSVAYCESMTASDGGVWTVNGSDDNVHFVADLASAFGGDPGEHTEIVPHGNRLAVASDRLWIADPEAGAAIPYALPSGRPLPTLELKGATDWISGMTYLQGNLLVLQGARIVVFDSETGEPTDTISLEGHGEPAALACRTAAP